jgi:hypothetical protein
MSDPETPAAVEPAPEPTVIEKVAAVLAKYKHDIIGTAPALWLDLNELVAAETPAAPAAEPEATA